jgi:predicted glycosyltransferase
MSRILFDISHPAHVHLFKYAIGELQQDGHEVAVTSREKDITVDLLDAYGIDHTPISKKGESKASLISEWIRREAKMVKIARSFEPDVIVSRLNPPAAHASVAAGCPSVVFDDSEKAQFAAKITHPFADVICTPANFSRNLGRKQRRYNGFHELAYLHSNRFEPDSQILRKHGVDPDQEYAVLRFVSWGAHHDINQMGFSQGGKRKLIDTLNQHVDIYITSERELPPEFEEYRLPIPPELIHQLLYHANIYVGDSQTMATEAAVLGTPAVRSNTFAGENDMSNFIRLESEYELLYSTADEQEAIALVEQLSETSDLEEMWHERRERLIEDTVDVTSYMLSIIDEQVTYPNMSGSNE